MSYSELTIFAVIATSLGTYFWGRSAGIRIGQKRGLVVSFEPQEAVFDYTMEPDGGRLLTVTFKQRLPGETFGWLNWDSPPRAADHVPK